MDYKIAGVLIVAAMLTVGSHGVELDLTHTGGDDITEGGQYSVSCVVTGGSMGTSLFWYKRQHVDDEIQIGANGDLNEVFKAVPRYHMEGAVEDGGIFRATLTVSDALAEDSGTYRCTVASTDLSEDTPPIVIKVPVAEVHMFSLPTGSVDSEAIEEYQDGQKVEMAAGENYFFRCTAIGGNPEPKMTITLGDMDVTDHFQLTQADETVGNPGLEKVNHKVIMTSTSAITITNDMNAYAFKCAAASTSDDTRSVTIEPVMSFPPLVTCPATIETNLYTGIDVTCTVKSNPKATSMSASWEVGHDPDKTNETITLQRPEDGHYKISVKQGATTDEKRVTLHIDQMFPQMFRTYYVAATNAMGTSYVTVELVDDKSIPGSAGVAIKSSFVVLVSVCLLPLCRLL